MYNNLVNVSAKGKFLSARIPADKDMALLMMKGEKKMVQPIKSTNFGDGNQLLAMTR